MDEDIPSWDILPPEVNAVVTNDGEEFLSNADADSQNGENFYGQNQTLAGNAAWNNKNYPGQTVQNPDSVANTTDYGDYGSPTGAGAAGTSTTVALDPYSGLTGKQLQDLGGADPTDPYIRARLGIPQLPGSPLSSLPSTSNFFNSIKDVATSVTGTVQKAVSSLTTKSPATSPYPNASPVRTVPTSKSAAPVTDEFGLVILNDQQTNQLLSGVNPAYRNGLAPEPVPIINKVTGEVTYNFDSQIAADAARLNAQTPNPYLVNIDEASVQIARANEGISAANETIQQSQQYISDSQSIIAQNNAELANPNISAERRVELESNNAQQALAIDQNQNNIDTNSSYITQATENKQFNEGIIDTNAAGYRASTAGSNAPVADPYAGLTPAQLKELGNADPTDPYIRARLGIPQLPGSPLSTSQANSGNFLTTSAAPVNTQDGQAYGDVFPDPNGNGGFVNANGDPVNPDGSPIPAVARSSTAIAVDPANTGFRTVTGVTAPFFGANPDAEAEAAAAAQVGRQLAQQQAVNAAQKKIANNGDWRVRLSLAPGARYLYNVDGDPGILQPLAVTGGVVFPYTPRIEMSYKADYESYALTHSNYKGYFYKSSSVDAINMTATFTAQDSAEANYLLAVIHFFRSVTKMFYGQDAQRGAPPPLVYLTGLGQYQFNGHPCLVTSFNYNLPGDVDYIRARSPNINGTNMLTRRDKQDLPTNPISGAVARLQNLFSGQGISYGAEICRPPPPTLGLNNPTYVPTKLDISLNLLPVQTRSQVTNQFSLQQYATGALLGGSPGTSGKGGFW